MQVLSQKTALSEPQTLGMGILLCLHFTFFFDFGLFELVALPVEQVEVSLAPQSLVNIA